MVPELPLISEPVPVEPPRGPGRSSRALLVAKGIVAANLGAALGYAIWLSVQKDSRDAAVLTLAEYTARFESYRSDLVNSGKSPMLFYALLVAVFALFAAGVYEFLARGLALFLTDTRVGRALAPWRRDAGRSGSA
jgi:hypothetical protein